MRSVPWLVVALVLTACKSGHDVAPDLSPSIAPVAVAVDPTESARQHRVGKIRGWTPAQRLAWVKHCLPLDCGDDEIVDVVHAGATVEEQSALGEVGFVRSIALFAAGARDGDVLSEGPITSILDVYRADPDVPVALLPHATRAAAMKDMVTGRGRFVSVSGTVLQIQREGSVFWSTFTEDTGSPCYLITALDAEGVDEGKRATFEGVVVQRYSYANTIGGAAQSLLLVGKFAGKARRPVQHPTQ